MELRIEDNGMLVIVDNKTDDEVSLDAADITVLLEFIQENSL